MKKICLFIYFIATTLLGADEPDMSNQDKLYHLFEPQQRAPNIIEKERPNISKYSPQPFRAALIDGARLINLETKEVMKIPRTIYIKAQLEEIGSAHAYILEKDNSIKYKTESKYLIPVEADLDLGVKPSHLISYPPKTDYHSDNEQFKIQTSLTYEYDPSFYSNIKTNRSNYLQEDLMRTSDNNFTMKSLFKWSLPISLGLISTYQNSTYSYDESRYQENAFYIGPLLNYELFKLESLALDLQLSYSYSLFHQFYNNNERISSRSQALKSEIHARYLFNSFFVVGGLNITNYNHQIGHDQLLKGSFSQNEMQMNITIGIGKDFSI